MTKREFEVVKRLVGKRFEEEAGKREAVARAEGEKLLEAAQKKDPDFKAAQKLAKGIEVHREKLIAKGFDLRGLSFYGSLDKGLHLVWRENSPMLAHNEWVRKTRRALELRLDEAELMTAGIEAAVLLGELEKLWK